jgi:hypothetical protein
MKKAYDIIKRRLSAFIKSRKRLQQTKQTEEVALEAPEQLKKPEEP